MSARTKKPITGKYSEICIRVPVQDVEKFRELLKSSGQAFEIWERELDSAAEVFPDSHPGKILKGLRTREDLSQAQLAEKAGLKPHHVSEMEHGKRVIGKAMAKKLAAVLNTSYKMFL
jgi:ribosome-binding protein aMBF1 (putative translation factor)